MVTVLYRKGKMSTLLVLSLSNIAWVWGIKYLPSKCGFTRFKISLQKTSVIQVI